MPVLPRCTLLLTARPRRPVAPRRVGAQIRPCRTSAFVLVRPYTHLTRRVTQLRRLLPCFLTGSGPDATRARSAVLFDIRLCRNRADLPREGRAGALPGFGIRCSDAVIIERPREQGRFGPRRPGSRRAGSGGAEEAVALEYSS